MLPIALHYKFIPTRGQYRTSPMLDLAEEIKRIPNQLIQNSYHSFIQYQSEFKVRHQVIREEKNRQNPKWLSGLTVAFELVNSMNMKEVLHVHLYESERVEYPQSDFTHVHANLIGAEKCPILALAMSQYLAGISL